MSEFKFYNRVPVTSAYQKISEKEAYDAAQGGVFLPVYVSGREFPLHISWEENDDYPDWTADEVNYSWTLYSFSPFTVSPPDQDEVIYSWTLYADGEWGKMEDYLSSLFTRETSVDEKAIIFIAKKLMTGELYPETMDIALEEGGDRASASEIDVWRFEDEKRNLFYCDGETGDSVIAACIGGRFIIFDEVKRENPELAAAASKYAADGVDGDDNDCLWGDGMKVYTNIIDDKSGVKLSAVVVHYNRCPGDGECDRYGCDPDLYFLHVLTNDLCDDPASCFSGWSDGDEDAEEGWARIREAMRNDLIYDCLWAGVDAHI